MAGWTRGQKVAALLFGIAVVCFFIFVFSANIFQSGNRVAMLAIAVGGTATTVGAYIWGRETARPS